MPTVVPLQLEGNYPYSVVVDNTSVFVCTAGSLLFELDPTSGMIIRSIVYDTVNRVRGQMSTLSTDGSTLFILTFNSMGSWYVFLEFY